ncbi:MAG: 4Fe-4S dicluster domain-containing protein [Candidatus Omnitrophica bacterium]|nr:4Fe-4S dicluster domain-containing protein [Candidatus Omnitrophota bacterium]
MITKRIVLKFPSKLIDKPIVYRLVKDYGLVFNILRARVTPKEEGEMVVELQGEQGNFSGGVKYLKDLGVKMQPLSQDVTRDDARCTHCGACVTVCPTGALRMDKETMQVVFESEKCIACEVCVPACPPRAMKVKF